MIINALPARLDKHKAITRVILVPKKDNPYVQREFDNDWDTFVNEWHFSADDWDVSFEIGPSKEYEAVAAIVGDEKAIEVLEALGR